MKRFIAVLAGCLGIGKVQCDVRIGTRKRRYQWDSEVEAVDGFAVNLRMELEKCDGGFRRWEWRIADDNRQSLAEWELSEGLHF